MSPNLSNQTISVMATPTTMTLMKNNPVKYIDVKNLKEMYALETGFTDSRVVTMDCSHSPKQQVFLLKLSSLCNSQAGVRHSAFSP